MTSPIITIESISRSKIGKEANVDSTSVLFSTNQDLMEWEARAGGQGVGQGLLVGEQRAAIEDGYALKLQNPWNESVQDYGSSWLQFGIQTYNSISYGNDLFVVDNEELTWGDKIYHINIYGKNEAGEWTNYGNLLGSNSSFEQGLWETYGSTAGNLSLVSGSYGSSQAARIEMVADGVKGLKSTVNFSLNEGDIVTVSFLAKGNRNDVILNYIYFMSDIAANSSIGTVTLNTKWQHYEIEWTVPSGRSANDYDILMALYSGRRGVVIGDWVELDDVWITKEG